MVIKPLENNNGFYVRFFLIATVIIIGLILSKKISPKKYQPEVLGRQTVIKKSKDLEKEGINFINATTKKIGKTVNNVLGEATSTIIDTASKSAESISDFVFDNTIGNILKQFEKLPKAEQERIKERICK